ncbi:MAG: hypothetical protein IJO88_03710 [Oscillospiraceae bacterium]|nr:hypothetical protein [Oscillospiraceae bacterium]
MKNIKLTPVKEVLFSVEEQRCQVERLRRSVDRLQARCGTVVSAWGSGHPARSKGPEDLLTFLADQKDMLAVQEEKLRELEAKIESWIGLLPMPRWRMVIRAHYLDGMDFFQITEELSRITGRDFTINQVYRFHRLALEAAEELWPLD